MPFVWAHVELILKSIGCKLVECNTIADEKNEFALDVTFHTPNRDPLELAAVLELVPEHVRLEIKGSPDFEGFMVRLIGPRYNWLEELSAGQVMKRHCIARKAGKVPNIAIVGDKVVNISNE